MRQDFHYTIDRDELVRWVSDEWLAFGAANGWERLDADAVLGHPVWEFIAGREVQLLYRALFAKARERGAEIRVPFRCDAPSLRRWMRLTIVPHPDGSLELVGTVLREEPRAHVALLDDGVPRTDELITACSWCRRLHRPPDRWIEVEEAVRELGLFEQTELPGITHGICPDCLAEIDGI